MQTDLRGAIEIEWESDRDLRCSWSEDCERPVKHRIIGHKWVYLCHECFTHNDWQKAYKNGIEFDVSERSPLNVYWTSQKTSTNLSSLWEFR